jgi:hypothetical protein
MLHLYDRATMAHALTLGLNPRLHNLLGERIEALSDELIDYTEFLVVQTGDTEADILEQIGLSPLINPVDGAQYGTAGFEPHWDWLAAHDGYWEMLFTFGSTFAYIVFVTDADGVLPELRRLCSQFATQPL